ncbi:hypothetical protein [Chryseobacterium sp. RLHN22]|uniref:hypothetical protein n=1 Tax=Chryseobacterium sp. RLHN22 TaxID=3437885 RepID=UPI003D9BAA19
MSEFKLIAITPLKGCSSEFSKKLKIGHPYQFYKNYAIELEDSGDEIKSIVKLDRNTLPDHLYNLSNGISLSISSVIGKNGTGKSTLMELLYQVIYRLAVQEKFYGNTLLKSPTVDLEFELKNLKGVLFDLCESVSYLNFKDYGLSSKTKFVREGHKGLNLYLFQLVRRYRLDIDIDNIPSDKDLVKRIAARLQSKISDTENLIIQTIEKEKRFKSKFNVSVIYEIKNEIREIQIKSGEIKYFNFTDHIEQKKIESNSEPNLKNLFYTISLNYSHHGLNSKVMGLWVNKLFHKNDAYRTPLVLNPMRDEGNFNINHEIKLSNERLMSTLIYDLVNKKENWILDKYKISSFIFTIKSPHLYNLVDEHDFKKLPYASIIERRYKVPSSSRELPHAHVALSYLNRKIGKVADQYGFLFQKTNDSIFDLNQFLEDEDSHITKKIKQTTNYLCRSIEELNPIWNNTKRGRGLEIHLSPKELLNYIDLFKPENELGPSELIEYALPSFFNIDFEFQERNHKKIRLSAMSSGEQQMIFNVNAIMYHLYNLESVHKSEDNSETKKIRRRPAYPNINIVLDEMELYYHPEMQRRFISDMIKAFENLRPGKIEAINVCILTHSPFILSDIPLQNILRLTEDSLNGSAENRQTFASNIHELLRKEFMLEKGFFGEYARQKIEQVINSLKIHAIIIKSGLNELSEIKNIKKILIKEDEFKDFDMNDFLTEKECKELIGLVGEPVLYKSLVEFYSEVFPKKKKSFIEQQIEMLQKLQNE